MNAKVSVNVKRGWEKIKTNLNSITDRYTLSETISELKKNDLYKHLYGKGKNRILIKKNPILYLSIYDHTKILELILKKQKTWKGSYNFKYRVKFLIEYNSDINKLKCECGKKYVWTSFCRKCPSYHNTWEGKTHSIETKRKQRISTLKHLESKIGNQIVPRYNKNAISIIENYGKKYGYNFIHAENGGEFYIKELGYFLDAYDPIKNVVLEIDENRHNNPKYLKKDKIRQIEIKNHLKCKFIRIKI
jgi:hypothetical protein